MEMIARAGGFLVTWRSSFFYVILKGILLLIPIPGNLLGQPDAETTDKVQKTGLEGALYVLLKNPRAALRLTPQKSS